MSQTPKPGRPVRRLAIGCPCHGAPGLVGATMDIGRSVELSKGGPCTSASCKNVAKRSRRRFSIRGLKELREAGWFEHSHEGYRANTDRT